MKIEVSARADERPRCVYCRDEVAPAELDERPGCRTTLHVACRAELERCPTAGCADARVVLAPPEPGVDAEAVERKRRRDAARARRQAEDEARSARARTQGDRARQLAQLRAEADAAPRSWPGVHRPESGFELALWLAAGGIIGLFAGWAIALFSSPHAAVAGAIASAWGQTGWGVLAGPLLLLPLLLRWLGWRESMRPGDW
jgi:hypothetical protein